MNELPEMRVNLGLLLRGDYKSLANLLIKIGPMLDETGVQFVHKQLSASKLWIKEGDGMNDIGKTH